MKTVLWGLGTATPPWSIAQADAAELAKPRCCTTDEQARLLPALYRRSHVERRGSVLLEPRAARAATSGQGLAGGADELALTGAPLHQSFYPPAEAGDAADAHGPTTDARMRRYARDAAPLALDACRAALADAGVAPARITHLVTVSCTGFAAPGVDVALIRGLGLSAETERTHVGFMGCHGALNGLRVASALAAADPRARVLLAAVELCSLHFHYGWDPEKIVANSLFADGAAAAVVGSSGPRDEAEADAWEIAAHGAYLFPDSEDAMTWRIGDHGFVMTLSAKVPALIRGALRGWMERWLASAGLTLHAVHSWAVHPGGPRIVGSVAEALGLGPHSVEASNRVLAAHGNMSSPTLLFILDELRRNHTPRPCVALGFGPGLAAEAVLLT